MFDKYLRPMKDKLLISLANKTASVFSPNQISFFSFFFGLLSCLMIFLHQIYPALAFWIINRLLDGLDGTVARISKKQSDWGGYLDIMLDFIIYALVPISFTIAYSTLLIDFIMLAVMLALFYINTASWMYLSALIEKHSINSNIPEQTSLSMPSGLMEGTETLVLFSLLYIFPFQIIYFYSFICLLTIIGIIQRISWGYKNIRIQ
jgi:phosphatidylglycerophosphate synthase